MTRQPYLIGAVALAIGCAVVVVISVYRWRAPGAPGFADQNPAVSVQPALAPPGESPDKDLGPSPLQPPLGSHELVRLLRAYQKLPALADRSYFDVKAKSEALRDIDSAFAFVRDEIANVVYPGTFRGPGATLSAQAGNDLDKAGLLGALLAEQGIVVRYARCTLDESAGQSRLRAMFAARTPADAPRRPGVPLKLALQQEGFPEARANGIARNLDTARDALHQVALGTARLDLQAVRDAMARATITPDPALGQEAVLADVSPHYWLQARRGDQWADLDPAFPDARLGQTFCSAESTYVELPPEVYHRVTFRVRNEYVDDTGLRSTTVLERTLRTVDVDGQLVVFTNVPVPPPERPSDVIGVFRRLEPVLYVGDEVFTGSEFDTGNVAPSEPTGLLADELGGSASPPTLVAQWLDFESSGPGRRLLESRAIVDGADPAERSAGAITSLPDGRLVGFVLAQPYAIVISTGRLDWVQVIKHIYGGLNVEATIESFAARSGEARAIRRGSAATDDTSVLTQAFRLALAVDEAMSDLEVGLSGDVRFLRDGPLIVMANFGPLLARGGRHLAAAGWSFDLRHNAARAIAKTREHDQDAFWHNAFRALVDGALEGHLISATASAGAVSATRTLSTSKLVAQAKQRGVMLTAYEAQAARRLLGETFGNKGGLRLASELTDHMAAVVPGEPVPFQGEDRLGMWAIDLETGHVLALLDTGLRQALTEREKAELKQIGWSDDTIKAYEQMRLRRLDYVKCLATQVSRVRPMSCKTDYFTFRDAVNSLREAVADEMAGTIDTVIHGRTVAFGF